MAGSSSGPSLMDSLFQRTLDDLIKSLRSATAISGADSPSLVLSRAVDDIRREIRASDQTTKAIALQKLTYICALHGVDISWAAFHPLELLPSPIFLHKKLGYLAASLSFSPSTSVLPLATHQLRKDLSSPCDPAAALALEFLSSPAASADLARDLCVELSSLLSSTRPRIRVKSTAASLRFFTLYPDSVRVAFKRLVENLECADQRVVSAAVGVFCELSAVDPKSYLPLAPEFYRILVDCRNNWILIKVLKIFSRLAPLEPRLAKRIVDPVCDHLRQSSAKSLVFECIRTVFTSLDGFDDAVKLGVEKLGEFLASEDDPNLRYLGLKGLSMLQPIHLWAVEESREIVVKSLGDPDSNIQREALHLIVRMVSDANLIEISTILLNYALKSDPEFANEILGEILSACCRNFYELVVDFDWYVSLLGDMSRHPHCTKGEDIEHHLVDIGLRVKDARPELVRVARDLLIDPALLGNPFICRILSAAAWVSGEYVELSRNPVELVEALLQPRVSLLPVSARAVYIQSVFKVLIFCLHSYLEQDGAGPLVTRDPVGGSQMSESSDAVMFEISSNCSFDSRIGLEGKDNASNVQRAHTSNDSAETKGFLTYDSLKHILDLIEMSLNPLVECSEVELQERARNILGFISALQKVQGSDFDEEGFRRDPRNCKLITVMADAFLEDLGPVSANAQGRVLVPDGVSLRDDLSDLDGILEGERLEEPSSAPVFFKRSDQLSEAQEEDLPSLTESKSLLAEHRRQHEVYYLPKESSEAEKEGYPRANEAPSSVGHGHIAEGSIQDLIKLTKESLGPRRTKPRPVVVKLDEGESVPTASSLKSVEPRDDPLSGVVREVLLQDGDEPTTSRRISSGNPSRRRSKGTMIPRSTGESAPHSDENLGDLQKGGRHHRSHSHRRQGRDGAQSRPETEDRGEEGKVSHKGSHRSNHPRRHRRKEEAEGPLNVIQQAPPGQDLLL
ncbi:unnamed protein product [Spirodela intermedia]|uniref:Clathrin/coatomer adaptor adaptin-like N-terminal domain-containing protein n=1 Tax=Spirodela intermedia TaxID=51605 RepID=A0A7I8LFF7_SPIIN|nr:unnamed protein product [Spirodela intermedia]